MDVKYINAFIRSTRQVFADMVHASLTSGRVFAKPDGVRIQNEYPLSAVISFTGAAEGMVVLSMTEDVAIAIATGLLGKPVIRLGDECADAVAEVANMIAAGAKKEVSSTPISITIPKVMRTDGVSYPIGMPVLIMPFTTASGKLVLQVAMRTAVAAAKAVAAAAAAAAEQKTPPAENTRKNATA